MNDVLVFEWFLLKNFQQHSLNCDCCYLLRPSRSSKKKINLNTTFSISFQDIEDFIIASSYGTILFSFGTNIKCAELPQEKLDAILGAFKELSDYNFLWKCDSKDIPRHPARNVLVQSYFPQNDILAHPKVKLFVTHAGIMSTQEATWYGVPMLGIPFIRDQRNVSIFIDLGIFVLF